MSVPTRNRKTPPLQFFATAIDIRVEVTRLMSSTAVIPKHWRFTFGEPACADAKRQAFSAWAGGMRGLDARRTARSTEKYMETLLEGATS